MRNAPPHIHRPRRTPGTAAAGRNLAIAFLALLVPLFGLAWWQGRPVPVVDAPGSRLPCVSYAPYRDGQTPFDAALAVPAAQIERDLERLRLLTACVRTYAVNQGLDQVPMIAEKLGMQVMLGAWIGRERLKNEAELARAIALARAHPQTVKAVIVGNEVLLRREQPPDALAAMIRQVRAAVPQQVTYADVWEFWQRHPEVAEAVDFVTIHTLPYWEDDPRPIGAAVSHVAAIWREMQAEFPGKPVFIGEAGWPSAGRMREGALPSRVNQARFVRELMQLAEREGIGLNLIEAFDQPWKRQLEGTVGGHWGLFDSAGRPKFPLQGPVVDDPDWAAHAAAATAIAALLLWLAARRFAATGGSARTAVALAAGAVVAGSLLTSGVLDGLVAARTLFDWLVLAIRAICAVLTVMLVLRTLAGTGRPAEPASIDRLIAAIRERWWPRRNRQEILLGALRATVLFGAAASTLCLVFDPRYRDFTSALYAVPALTFLALAAVRRIRREAIADPLREERLLAAVLAAGGLAVLAVEGLANHQALAWVATIWTLGAAVMLEPRRSASAYARTSASAPSSTPPAAASGP
jgi:exo-beta-1,3-glucanase (GH17 family)